MLLVGVHEFTDDYGDLEDSALDAEGPAALVYRFSRRKSDTNNDDNSQSSKFNLPLIVKTHELRSSIIIDQLVLTYISLLSFDDGKNLILFCNHNRQPILH